MWETRLRIRRRLLVRAKEKLAYRGRKHRYYHHKSKRPEAERKRLATKWHRLEKKAEALVDKRVRQVDEARRHVAKKWGGCRLVTERIIDIVDGRAKVTSRKRWELFGNPSSDHYRGNKLADAVDFGTADNHALKNEISQGLGGPSQLADYQSFYISMDGMRFRVQAIAGTHGTGPHLHYGVARA